MYLNWLNQKLEKIGKSVKDIGPSLKDGTVIMDAIKVRPLGDG